LLAGLLAAYPFSPRLNAGRLEVTVLDVGQGDSIFVAFPDGRTMLVDGGGLPGSAYIKGARPALDVGEDVVSPYLWTRGLKRIDVVALTHGHEDHMGGLPAVLRNFRVGQLWVGRDVDSSAYRALLATAKARGVPVSYQVKGNSYDWDGVGIYVLWPPDDNPVKTANRFSRCPIMAAGPRAPNHFSPPCGPAMRRFRWERTTHSAIRTQRRWTASPPKARACSAPIATARSRR